MALIETMFDFKSAGTESKWICNTSHIIIIGKMTIIKYVPADM